MNDVEQAMTVAPLRSFAVAALLLACTAVAALAAEVTFTLAISKGRVPENMRLIRVKQNDVVKLRWSTDRPMQIHLHGYDITKDLRPGSVTEMAFTARATGRFTVAPHTGPAAGGSHGHGEVLVTVEVYP
jgi:hypothetical protein